MAGPFRDVADGLLPVETFADGVAFEIIAAGKTEKLRLHVREQLHDVRARAVRTLSLIHISNRIGHEILDGVGGDGIEFWGQSFVAGTSGEIISQASASQEEILIVPVDLANVDTTRTHWPFPVSYTHLS